MPEGDRPTVGPAPGPDRPFVDPARIVLVVGAMRTGTTLVARFLGSHPDVDYMGVRTRRGVGGMDRPPVGGARCRRRVLPAAGRRRGDCRDGSQDAGRVGAAAPRAPDDPSDLVAEVEHERLVHDPDATAATLQASLGLAPDGLRPPEPLDPARCHEWRRLLDDDDLRALRVAPDMAGTPHRSPVGALDELVHR